MSIKLTLRRRNTRPPPHHQCCYPLLRLVSRQRLLLQQHAHPLRRRHRRESTQNLRLRTLRRALRLRGHDLRNGHAGLPRCQQLKFRGLLLAEQHLRRVDASRMGLDLHYVPSLLCRVEAPWYRPERFAIQIPVSAVSSVLRDRLLQYRSVLQRLRLLLPGQIQREEFCASVY